jgi:hypothetical protein
MTSSPWHLTRSKEAGVEVVVERRVASVTSVPAADGGRTHLVSFTDGSHLLAGHVVEARSKSIPSTDYLPPSALDSQGYVKINNL